jgi:hypothetical protein
LNLEQPILSVDTGGGMCPDTFETDVPTPGDEVDGIGINVIEIWWNLIDVCPPQCPDSISELFEEAVETPMVEIELVLEGLD